MQMQEYDVEYAEYLFYSPTELDIESPFWLLRAGSNVAKPHYRVGPRRIECYSIHFVREGTLIVESGGKQSVLSAGDVFCMYPNRTYVYYKPNDPDTLRLSWFRIDGPGMEKLIGLAGFKPESPYLKGKWSPELQELIEQVLHRLREPGTDKLTACLELKSLMYHFFAKFIPAGDTQRSGPSAKQSWIEPCMSYIRLHAAEGITVEQVARFAGLNRSYFSTLFTKTAGISPAEYIASVKMSKAKELLLGTPASVTEIANSLGYSTLFAFTRAFKTYHSLSPSAYRNQNNTK
ncbi:AraC family transcriptional regulator [Paenibacillus pasadenensis]|uniref:AraC family transcriptional regulator n=1 Tax=Paenibacillus pasadenensis TaxID=217090 RepID=UPI002042116D|nr:AraC family transcriptional regulator [Paenibacillus pasadenensis]MCM3746207.1 AraC family transcriptional regulator [Paenibacillus pasadenensis]